jgi:archaemetzincin
MATVLLTPIAFVDDQALIQLAKPIKQQFQYDLRIVDIHLELDDCYNAERTQYSANDVLEKLIGAHPDNDSKIVGVTDLDLYIPVLTFIFGQAYLNGRAAIVSAHRLRNEYYGLDPNTDLFWKRLEKLIIHELGHSFGLIHCSNLDCVMISSTYVEEIDQKSINLCDDCFRKISNNII